MPTPTVPTNLFPTLTPCLTVSPLLPLSPPHPTSTPNASLPPLHRYSFPIPLSQPIPNMVKYFWLYLKEPSSCGLSFVKIVKPRQVLLFTHSVQQLRTITKSWQIHWWPWLHDRCLFYSVYKVVTTCRRKSISHFYITTFTSHGEYL